MKAIKLIALLAIIACASSKRPKDPVKATLYDNHNKFQECYRESDTYMNREAQSVKLSFMVTPEGKAQDVEVAEQAVKDPNFSSCILGTLKSLTFPLAEAEIRYLETMVFNLNVPK